MGVQFNLRQAVYQALIDELVDAFGDVITDGSGSPITRGDPLGLDGVYDTAPQAEDPAVPLTYAVIGSRITRAKDTKNTRGYTTLLRIYTHSRSTTVKTIEDVQDKMFDVLHYRFQALSVIVNREGSDILQGADGRHFGVCEYLFTIMDI